MFKFGEIEIRWSLQKEKAPLPAVGTCSMLQPSFHPNSTCWLNNSGRKVGVTLRALLDILHVNFRQLSKLFFLKGVYKIEPKEWGFFNDKFCMDLNIGIRLFYDLIFKISKMGKLPIFRTKICYNIDENFYLTSTSFFNFYFSKVYAFFSKQYIFKLEGHHDNSFLFVLYNQKGGSEIKIIFSKTFTTEINLVSKAGLICACQIKRNACACPCSPKLPFFINYLENYWSSSSPGEQYTLYWSLGREDQQISFIFIDEKLSHQSLIIDYLEESCRKTSSPPSFHEEYQLFQTCAGKEEDRSSSRSSKTNRTFHSWMRKWRISLLKLIPNLTCVRQIYTSYTKLPMNHGSLFFLCSGGKLFLDLVLKLRSSQLAFLYRFDTCVLNGCDEVEK
ncbi:hypothetical protein VP01_5191g1 [Puccinia sorghi]|uniref:Uncharacterized protein n=1 Tax=Puccinia sorghi TaxID=27349 RepID=A0A0L6ULH9_9BASI|nr:hypothetical protein VP01_5191g1 [Puccinia sorghi]